MTAEYVEPTEAEVEAASGALRCVLSESQIYFAHNLPLSVLKAVCDVAVRAALTAAAKVRAQQQESGK